MSTFTELAKLLDEAHMIENTYNEAILYLCEVAMEGFDYLLHSDQIPAWRLRLESVTEACMEYSEELEQILAKISDFLASNPVMLLINESDPLEVIEDEEAKAQIRKSSEINLQIRNRFEETKQILQSVTGK